MKFKIFVVVLVVVIIGVMVSGIYIKFSTFLNNMVGTKTTIITSDMVIDKIGQVSELTTTKYTIQLVAKSETVGSSSHYE